MRKRMVRMHLFLVFSCQNAFISYFSWMKMIFNLYFKTSNPILRVTRDPIK